MKESKKICIPKVKNGKHKQENKWGGKEGKVGWKTQRLQTQKIKIATKHSKYSEENYWKGNGNKTAKRSLN